MAQNIFSTILLQEAQQSAINLLEDGGSEDYKRFLRHGVSVTSIEERKGIKLNEHYSFVVHTSSRETFETDYVVAADGSKSQIQNNYNGHMIGNPSIQSLMNVHFRTSPSLSKRLMEREKTVGMLHFVFHQKLVGAFVCHNLLEGEWVLQVCAYGTLHDGL